MGIWPLFGFLATVAGLMLYADSDRSGGLDPFALVLLALTAWVLESMSTGRKPVDFSSGFVFYLGLAFLGDATAAVLVMIAGACVRLFSGKVHLWDLLWTAPTLIALLAIQHSSGWPVQTRLILIASAVVLLLTGIVFYLGSTSISAKLIQAGHRETARIEMHQRSLRGMLLLASPMGAVLPVESAWAMVLLAPVCLAVQKAAANIGFRVHAQEAVFIREEVEQSRQELTEMRRRLESATEHKKVLEELTSVFAQPQSPTEAFAALGRVTSVVVDYSSLILCRVNRAGNLEPSLYKTPTPELVERALRHGVVDPCVQGAWDLEKARMGKAPVRLSDRLVSTESEVVAVPLKPLGVLYFGKTDSEPFTRSEASRLVYVAKRAAPALLQADRDAESQQTIREKTKMSEQLQKKVALMGKLLGGVQNVVAADKPEQIFAVLEELLTTSVPHHFGVVLSREQNDPVRIWGHSPLDETALNKVARQVLSSQRVLYLADMKRTAMPTPVEGTASLLAVPMHNEQEISGILIIGAEEHQAFSEEQHDFICTAAYLVGSGLTSLALFSRLKSAHQQVVQASKLSAVGRLAAGVAHELNTPLAAIGLAIEAAALRPEKAASKLERANKALIRARDIVRGLLDHARGSGSERSLVSIVDVFEGVHDLLGPQLMGKKIRLRCEPAEKLDRVLSNLTDLQQVFINLVLNGADASEPGSEILLSAAQHGTTIEIAVQDWGEGIPEDAHDKIFDPFFTTKPVGQGTGLGLSVCRELVERHQGSLKFRSEPGLGTTFVVSLPARLTADGHDSVR